MTFNHEIFRKNLKKWAHISDLTYQEIADKASITRGYLNQIKSGSTKKRLNVDVLQRIANAVGCEPIDLITDSSPSLPVKKATTTDRKHTAAVLIAKETIEKLDQDPTEEKIDLLAHYICDAAIKMNTDIINNNLSEWLYEVIIRSKE